MISVKWTHKRYINIVGLLRNESKTGLTKIRFNNSFVFNLPFMTVIHIKIS